MRLLALLLLAVLLVWSWQQTQQSSPISYETHFLVQEEIREILKKNLITQHSELSDFYVKQLWTAPSPDNPETKLIAYVIYSFDRNTPEGKKIARQEIQAELLLEKTAEQEDQQVWTIKHFKTPKESIVFEEELKIYPKGLSDHHVKSDESE
ncbi:MAG: hypothetical protein NZ480_02795 [Bdellovibrionaceae bacterium]|nr:hypothetical protein [Pseudobdellovibrionaceae bacterium]MDW8190622.1 hypothetical protein [Pseudobdellovibrionaceae bacterium]